jgi:hypothetical protein
VALVAPFTVTVTSTVVLTVVPVTVSGGAVVVMAELEFTVKGVAGVVPNDTAVAPVNPLPVMTTGVPPVLGPSTVLSDVTVGGADDPDAVMSTASAPATPAGLWVAVGVTAAVTLVS